MPAELDPFIARLITKPEWLPTWSNHPWAAIADAGEPAQRRALERWNAVREQGDIEAYAGVAVLLAEAFDDDRALLGLAQAVTREELFESLLPYAHIMTPGLRCARSLEKLFLTRLLHELSSGRLRTDIVDAIRHMRIDDHGDAYLPTRRALATELNDTPVQDQAERFADRLLITAATATPNRPDVLRTVLSYWGEAEPLDDVATAEPIGDEAPASWAATCALIGGIRRASDAEKLIELAHNTDFWRDASGTGSAARDANEYVDALEASTADSAEDRLIEIAKADVSASGRAVASIASRRTRIAGLPPIAQPRADAVASELASAGALTAMPGKRGTQIIHRHASMADSPLDLAALVLGASGSALTFDLPAEKTPLVEHVTRSLKAIALATGHRSMPYTIEDHERIGAGVEVRNQSGIRAVFTDGRMGAPEFDALVPDDTDDQGRSLQRIRIDTDHVTYAVIDPAAWSSYLDWAASTPLPESSPVPARKSVSHDRPEGGFLGRLFGRG